jgi:hypothetical protein
MTSAGASDAGTPVRETRSISPAGAMSFGTIPWYSQMNASVARPIQ